jgi:hypothetical protein
LCLFLVRNRSPEKAQGVSVKEFVLTAGEATTENNAANEALL